VPRPCRLRDEKRAMGTRMREDKCNLVSRLSLLSLPGRQRRESLGMSLRLM